MKSEIIKNTGLKRIIRVELDKIEVTAALEEEFKKVQKTVALKGFRKGKVPLDQVKAMYSSKISQDVLENLVNKSYLDALDTHKLTPILMPKINVDEKTSNNSLGGFSFTAEFEVKPEIKLNDLTKISVTEEKVNVTDTQINEVLKRAAESKAKVTPITSNRPAQINDWVKIDFQGTLCATNTPVKNGSSKDFLLQLGSKSLIKGFEEGIVGMNTGEVKVLSLQFPKDYFQNDLAQALVDFKVTLNSINTKEFPEINDAFAKEISNLDSLTDFKKQIESHLRKTQEQSIKQKLTDDLLAAFEKIHEIQIPISMVEEQAKDFKKTATKKLMEQGMSEVSIEEYHKKWEKSYKDSAEKNVKTSFLIEALAQKENLFPKETDVTAYLSNLPKQTQSHYESPEKKHELKFKIMEENVIMFLKNKVTIE